MLHVQTQLNNHPGGIFKCNLNHIGNAFFFRIVHPFVLIAIQVHRLRAVVAVKISVAHVCQTIQFRYALLFFHLIVASKWSKPLFWKWQIKCSFLKFLKGSLNSVRRQKHELRLQSLHLRRKLLTDIDNVTEMFLLASEKALYKALKKLDVQFEDDFQQLLQRQNEIPFIPQNKLPGVILLYLYSQVF